VQDDVSYLELQATLGTTKCMGGQQSTRELLTMCRVERGFHLLDAGCGAGATPSYLAREYHCTLPAISSTCTRAGRKRLLAPDAPYTHTADHCPAGCR